MHPLELFKFCPVCGSPHFEYIMRSPRNVRTAGLCIYFNSSAATVGFYPERERGTAGFAGGGRNLPRARWICRADLSICSRLAKKG